MLLLAAVCIYSAVSDESLASFFLRTASILLVIFSWLMAPIIFNPYATSESLSNDLKNMHEWINADFTTSMLNDPALHIANAEPKLPRRKDEVNKWIANKASWQAWFLKSIVDEWEEEDTWFSREFMSRLKLIIQKSVAMAWQYFPWFVFCQFYWGVPSLYYLITLAACIVFMNTIDSRYTNQHEHFTIWKASFVICVPPIVVFFIYGNLSLGELVVSTILNIMVCFIILDFGLGVFNIFIKLTTVSMTWNKSIENLRELLIPRMQVPRVFIRLQRLWPFVALVLLSSVNLLTVIFSGGLTTLLFNGRVADVWNRAYLLQKHH